MLYCSWNNSFKDRTVNLEARISITLNEIGFELTTYIKVKSIKLKIMFLSHRIHKLKRSTKQMSCNFFHLLKYLCFKLVMLMRIGSIKIALELVVRQFICSLILSISVSFLLDCVIGQMDHLIHIINVILLTACANIALFVPIASNVSIVGSN